MDHVYKTIELTGSSKEGIGEAIETAVSRAGETIQATRWFEVTEIRGHLVDGKVDHWQVGVKIGFTLDENS